MPSSNAVSKIIPSLALRAQHMLFLKQDEDEESSMWTGLCVVTSKRYKEVSNVSSIPRRASSILNSILTA